MKALLLLLLAAPASAAAPRLVLVGGGERPPAALERFVAWAGGPRARLVVVPWASAEPEAAAEALIEELKPFPAAVLVAAPSTAAALALDVLFSSATGVFFTGGDQVSLMAAVDAAGLAERFRRMARQGVVFGGTSAGTAVMSPLMITGVGDFTKLDALQVGTAPGLGLLPGTVVDQHFLKRQRENRLFGLVSAHPELLGLGIDEDTALLVDGTTAECVGATAAMAVKAAGAGAWAVELVYAGSRYDLTARKVLPKGG
ncbi:cyanophycinase [bacterium]|nr:MAG: cyanophycinase [bacterium]